MRIILLISFFLLFITTSQAQNTQKPDAVYLMPIEDFQKDFFSLLNSSFNLEDIITVRVKNSTTMEVSMHKDLAAFWWEYHGEATDRKEICTHADQKEFINCLLKQANKKDIAVWQDRAGHYHAE